MTAPLPSAYIIRKRLGWEPNSVYQEAAINDRRLYKLISGGAQAGKSDEMSEEVVERWYELEKPGIIWLVGDKYENTEKEWDYIKAKLLRLGQLEKASSASSRVPRDMWLADGTHLKTLSVRDSENIAMESPDIIAVCEASQVSYHAYEKLRIRAATSGGCLLMSGTLERSQPWYGQLYRQWQVGDEEHKSFNLPSWENRHIYPGGIDDPKIVSLRQDISDELFLEHQGGIPRTPVEWVFGREFNPEYHVRSDALYVPGLPVEVAIDPGMNQSAHAIYAIQWPPGRPRTVFDEIYARPLSTQEAIRICKNRPWWGAAKTGVIDFQGTVDQQSIGTPAMVWEAEGVFLRGMKFTIADEIDRLRTSLLIDPLTKEPSIIFHPSCRGILSEFGYCTSPITGRMEPYRYRLDTHGDLVSANPINRHNHGIKAISYYELMTIGMATSHHTDVIQAARKW